MYTHFVHENLISEFVHNTDEKYDYNKGTLGIHICPYSVIVANRVHYNFPFMAIETAQWKHANLIVMLQLNMFTKTKLDKGLNKPFMSLLKLPEE